MQLYSEIQEFFGKILAVGGFIFSKKSYELKLTRNIIFHIAYNTCLN